MKRTVFIALLLLTALSFALADTSELTIKGYYAPAAEKTCSLKVWQPTQGAPTDSDRIYHSGSVTLDGSGLDISQSNTTTTLNNETVKYVEFPLFTWEVTSNFNTTYTLSFKMSPFQAFKGGSYYIPSHRILMTVGNATVSEDFYNPSSEDGTTQGTYPYVGFYVSGSTVRTTNFSYDNTTNPLNGSENNPASVTGTCKLWMFAIDEESGTTFDYSSNVTVELTVQ
ncbi:MAG: hypothetical protein J5785_02450 [Spirochaetales bacterium]|nr:hypothetical protein [Spirochaetales bacterium]